MKKLPEMDTLTNLLWISFGLMGGFSYYLDEDYWICGIFFLVAVLYGYKLITSQWGKLKSRRR